MSDAPEGSDATRGGKVRGDEALEDATSTGRNQLGASKTGGEADDNSNTQLQAEEGGFGGGGA